MCTVRVDVIITGSCGYLFRGNQFDAISIFCGSLTALHGIGALFPYSLDAQCPVGRVAKCRMVVVETIVHYAHHYPFACIATLNACACLHLVGAGLFTGNVEHGLWCIAQLHIHHTLHGRQFVNARIRQAHGSCGS